MITISRNGAQGEPATGLVTRSTNTANGRARARLTAPARKSRLRQIHADRHPEQGGPGCEGGALEHRPIQHRRTSVVRCDAAAARHAASVSGAVHRMTAGKDPHYGSVAQQVEHAVETREGPDVRFIPDPRADVFGAKASRQDASTGEPMTAGKDPHHASGWRPCESSVSARSLQWCGDGSQTRVRFPVEVLPSEEGERSRLQLDLEVCTRRVRAASVPPMEAISAAPNDGGDACMRRRAAVDSERPSSTDPVSPVGSSSQCHRSRDRRGETRTLPRSR